MVSRLAEVIQTLSRGGVGSEHRRGALQEFARLSGWKPSDVLLDDRRLASKDTVSGHLVVEHGLIPSAVITFLVGGRRFDHLGYDTQTDILSISYNNLIDWHLFPDQDGVSVVYNRSIPASATRVSPSPSAPDAWRVEALERVLGRRSNPNIKALDDALVDTISFWRRALASEVGYEIAPEVLSRLFNILILIRAVEDDRRRSSGSDRKALLDERNVSTIVRQRPVTFTEPGPTRPAAWLV